MNQGQGKVLPALLSRKAFMEWLEDDRQTFLTAEKNKSASVVVKVPKTSEISYLFGGDSWNGSGFTWNTQLEFCGIYVRPTKELHLVDRPISQIVTGLTEAELQDIDSLLREKIVDGVNARTEMLLPADRRELPVEAITDQRIQKRLEEYREYGAEEDAVRRFFTGRVPDGRPHGAYRADTISEDAMLTYLLNPEGYIQAEAERYIRENAEWFLSEFERSELLLSTYQALEEDTGSPFHRMRAITEAVERCGAKSVAVTIQKGGDELTFRTAAAALKGNRSYYNRLDITASDRREFEQMFGRYADYTAEDVTKITYGRAVIYEATPAQTETEEMNMTMGGM